MSDTWSWLSFPKPSERVHSFTYIHSFNRSPKLEISCPLFLYGALPRSLLSQDGDRYQSGHRDLGFWAELVQWYSWLSRRGSHIPQKRPGPTCQPIPLVLWDPPNWQCWPNGGDGRRGGRGQLPWHNHLVAGPDMEVLILLLQGADFFLQHQIFFFL